MTGIGRWALAALCAMALAGCEMSQETRLPLSNLVEPPTTSLLLNTKISVETESAAACADTLPRIRSAYRNYLISELAQLSCAGAMLEIRDRTGLASAPGALGHYEGLTWFLIEAEGDDRRLVLRFNGNTLNRLQAELGRADAALSLDWTGFDVVLVNDGEVARAFAVGEAGIAAEPLADGKMTLLPGATGTLSLTREGLAQLREAGTLTLGRLVAAP